MKKDTADSLLEEACMDLAMAGDKLLALDELNPVGERLLHMVDALLCYIEQHIYADPETYGLRKPESKKKLTAVK